MQDGHAFPLSLIEEDVSLSPCKGSPTWGTGFLASIQCNTLPRSAKTKPKNCQKETSSGDGNQIENTLINSLPEKEPSSHHWLLKCQQYLHHCAGHEEGLRRANSLLCCNSDLTIQVPALHPTVPLTTRDMIFLFLLFFIYVL